MSGIILDNITHGGQGSMMLRLRWKNRDCRQHRGAQPVQQAGVEE